jgi:DNA (cytosine-5)-methyltransferase 1
MESKVEIESYILNSITYKLQNYIFSKEYPYWLIYRNEFFDTVASSLKFNIFTAFRDRQITKKITRSSGNIRVLKSRNIGSNAIIDLPGYDCYIDTPEELGVSKYMNKEHAVLVPNLTYSPRACFLPMNTITDGSVAILTLRNGSRQVNEQDLEYYNSEEFERFYAIARNYGTRSLNIDNNSVFFFGIQKDN